MTDEFSRSIVDLQKASDLISIAGASSMRVSRDHIFNDEYTRTRKLNSLLRKTGSCRVLELALEDLQDFGFMKSLQAVPSPLRMLMSEEVNRASRLQFVPVSQSRLLREFFDLESGVCFIIGKGRSGKTAKCYSILDYIRRVLDRRVMMYKYPLNFRDSLPDGFDVLSSFAHSEEGDIIVIDDAVLRFSSRNFRNNANVELGKYSTVMSHARQHLVVVTQHMKSFDTISARHQEMMVVVCPSVSANVSMSEERDEFVPLLMYSNEILSRLAEEFPAIDPKSFGVVHYGSERENIFSELPWFWSDGLSRPFRSERLNLEAI